MSYRNRVFIHYYDDIYSYIIDDDFFKQYIMDDRIDEIYCKGSYINFITTNDNLIDEIECRYNQDI
jgi:hypothetical protein